MKVLITGGAGFIGSNLAELLLNKGQEVYCIDDLSTGRLQNVHHLRQNPRFHLAVETILMNRSWIGWSAIAMSSIIWPPPSALN
jgi:nucleoside-diphosphate-sugar epimerase